MVEGFAGHGDEHRGDAQRVAVGVFQDVGGAGDVPAGVAAGFEGVAEPAIGEAGGVGLPLDEGFAGELGDGGPVGGRLEEAVVFLGGEPGQGEETVGVVGGTFFQSPVFHGGGDDVGDGRVERFGMLDGGHGRT